MRICYGILFVIAAVVSCKEPVSQEELIATAVEIRMEQWRQEQIQLCRQNAVDKAAAYVDSILIVTSLDTKLDTIPKPPKPEKPVKPVFKDKPDSLRIEEILKDTSRGGY